MAAFLKASQRIFKDVERAENDIERGFEDDKRTIRIQVDNPHVAPRRGEKHTDMPYQDLAASEFPEYDYHPGRKFNKSDSICPL